jgi:hypothetical protein
MRHFAFRLRCPGFGTIAYAFNFCLMVQGHWVQDCQKIKERILFSGFGPLSERVSPAVQFDVPIK